MNISKKKAHVRNNSDPHHLYTKYFYVIPIHSKTIWLSLYATTLTPTTCTQNTFT